MDIFERYYECSTINNATIDGPLKKCVFPQNTNVFSCTTCLNCQPPKGPHTVKISISTHERYPTYAPDLLDDNRNIVNIHYSKAGS